MLLSGRSLVSPQADPSASLGDEAPLSADGRERRTIEGRGINMRWFSGTVLTGLCGAGLMGGAVWAALENPDKAAGARRDSSAAHPLGERRGRAPHQHRPQG